MEAGRQQEARDKAKAAADESKKSSGSILNFFGAGKQTAHDAAAVDAMEVDVGEDEEDKEEEAGDYR